VEGRGKEAALEAGSAAAKGGPAGLVIAFAKDLLDGSIARIPKGTAVQLLDPPGVRAHIFVLGPTHQGLRGMTLTEMLAVSP
jgi:hypothetical protein